MIERLALGTVQFGLKYGVAGNGQVPPDEVGRILALASGAGIVMLDTAEAYGSAETVLGQIGVQSFRVVGKLGRRDAAGDLRKRAEASLARLRIDRFEVVLLHAPGQLLEDRHLAGEVLALRSGGLARAIGFSVYEPAELERLSEVLQPDVVQLPASAIDARWDQLLPALQAKGIRVHLRSAYLQGLLMLPATPGWAQPWDRLLASWRGWVAEQGTTPAKAALALALARPVECVVIGVDNAGQLAQVLDLPVLSPLPAHLKTADPDLLDPRRWPKT
jgi:aryl-alcohol dehydrogenase-like predicted oxidoreductase